MFGCSYCRTGTPESFHRSVCSSRRKGTGKQSQVRLSATQSASRLLFAQIVAWYLASRCSRVVCHLDVALLVRTSPALEPPALPEPACIGDRKASTVSVVSSSLGLKTSRDNGLTLRSRSDGAGVLDRQFGRNPSIFNPWFRPSRSGRDTWSARTTLPRQPSHLEDGT